ncbi:MULTISPECIES: nuclear transport factor 2 family protein [Micrococcaceae]|uniref:nuclear transport factor 2 family protein n=1 Tax=Micrococcaceae TaxID=1268 RepID=UPI0006FC4C35|nr:nuclear transport factor 2 family protein [Arthrobacter sp. Soil761]KRE66425.1 hypothetical protein ASG79_10515 [Arthrobacter sp. Soil761]
MSNDVTAAEVRELHDVLCEAMVSRDVAQLDGILAEDYTLTHMTGYVQPRAEWLAAIQSGEMQYHRMETVEARFGAEGKAPQLNARTLTDATIWGSRGNWRLRLRSWFEPRGNGWVITHTVASTW